MTASVVHREDSRARAATQRVDARRRDRHSSARVIVTNFVLHCAEWSQRHAADDGGDRVGAGAPVDVSDT